MNWKTKKILSDILTVALVVAVMLYMMTEGAT